MAKGKGKSKKSRDPRVEARDRFLEEAAREWTLSRQTESGEWENLELEVYDNEKTYRQCRECVLDGELIIQVYPFGPRLYAPAQYGAEATYAKIINDRLLYWGYGVVPEQQKISTNGGS